MVYRIGTRPGTVNNRGASGFPKRRQCQSETRRLVHTSKKRKGIEDQLVEDQTTRQELGKRGMWAQRVV